MIRNLNRNHLAIAIILGVAALAFFGAIPQESVAGLGALPFMMGDIGEVKKLMDDQGRAWDEYKSANDALLKAKAEGKAVADLEAKVSRIDDALTKFTEAKKNIEDALLKMQRENLGGGEKAAGDLAIECKSFNDMRRANAPSGTAIADIDAEQYKTYTAAFWQLVRKGSLDALGDVERKALQAGVDSDGGYLLPTPTVGRVTKKVFELSPIRQIASVQTISTEALEGINDLDEASSAGWRRRRAHGDEHADARQVPDRGARAVRRAEGHAEAARRRRGGRRGLARRQGGRQVLARGGRCLHHRRRHRQAARLHDLRDGRHRRRHARLGPRWSTSPPA
jgi:hypothetical protein